MGVDVSVLLCDKHSSGRRNSLNDKELTMTLTDTEKNIIRTAIKDLERAEARLDADPNDSAAEDNFLAQVHHLGDLLDAANIAWDVDTSLDDILVSLSEPTCNSTK
jgi:hypothetical protein